MRPSSIAAAILLLAGCGSREDAAEVAASGSVNGAGQMNEAPALSGALAANSLGNAVSNPVGVTAPVAPPRQGGEAAGSAEASGPCWMQGAERLRVASLRAVGTEPFWGARVEGRCVTYTTPEDQQGIRVWTRYAAGKDGGMWSGALGGRLFELRTRAAPGCSDGMSDKKYPIAVELAVKGERRKGCAGVG